MSRAKVDGQMSLPLVADLSPRTRAWLESRVQPGWQADAACADADSSLFISDNGQLADPAREDQAKAVCADCPVRHACEAFALLNDEWGIWGGRTDADRADLRRAFADFNDPPRPTWETAA